MSEKIYTLLLRLYPSCFRQAYGEEALQLVRDRMRDERGAWRKLRLWVDLLVDLAISAPRQHLAGRNSALAAAPAQGSVSGVPSFRILEDEPDTIRDAGRCRTAGRGGARHGVDSAESQRRVSPESWDRRGERVGGGAVVSVAKRCGNAAGRFGCGGDRSWRFTVAGWAGDGANRRAACSFRLRPRNGSG